MEFLFISSVLYTKTGAGFMKYKMPLMVLDTLGTRILILHTHNKPILAVVQTPSVVNTCLLVGIFV